MQLGAALCCAVLCWQLLLQMATYRMQVGVTISLKCWLLLQEGEVLIERRCADHHANILQNQRTPD
jgi:hypothetical protein